jgi:hypothetical protein
VAFPIFCAISQLWFEAIDGAKTGITATLCIAGI